MYIRNNKGQRPAVPQPAPAASRPQVQIAPSTSKPLGAYRSDHEDGRAAIHLFAAHARGQLLVLAAAESELAKISHAAGIDVLYTKESGVIDSLNTNSKKKTYEKAVEGGKGDGAAASCGGVGGRRGMRMLPRAGGHAGVWGRAGLERLVLYRENTFWVYVCVSCKHAGVWGASRAHRENKFYIDRIYSI